MLTTYHGGLTAYMDKQYATHTEIKTPHGPILLNDYFTVRGRRDYGFVKQVGFCEDL